MTIFEMDYFVFINCRSIQNSLESIWEPLKLIFFTLVLCVLAIPLATITGFTPVPNEPCRYKKRGPLAGKIGGQEGDIIPDLVENRHHWGFKFS